MTSEAAPFRSYGGDAITGLTEALFTELTGHEPNGDQVYLYLAESPAVNGIRRGHNTLGRNMIRLHTQPAMQAVMDSDGDRAIVMSGTLLGPSQQAVGGINLALAPKAKTIQVRVPADYNPNDLPEGWSLAGEDA